MKPELPIEVDPGTGVWSTDGLPMIYMPRHFFVNNHIAAAQALGRERHAAALYRAGHHSAYFWCQQEAATHALSGMAVFGHYLKRLSQRGWGRFSIVSADAPGGRAQIRLEHSIFVLAQGTAGVARERAKLCYLFSGWFAGAMDWVLETGGSALRTASAETQCAAEHEHEHCPESDHDHAHGHCQFCVTPI